MLTDVRQAVAFTLVTMLLFGGVYPAGVWIVGRLALPAQAEGSLVRGAGGAVLGSRLIAQAFTQPAYVQPRPSAVGYDAASTGGSNHGPSNPEHLAVVRARLESVMRREGVAAAQVPSELVTASGAGLDPHLSPAAAALQAPRVAAARGVAPARVRALIDAHTDPPLWGFLGRARVNVLELNLALDAALGPPPVPAAGAPGH